VWDPSRSIGKHHSTTETPPNHSRSRGVQKRKDQVFLHSKIQHLKFLFSYDELTAIATASGTNMGPIPLRGANATPMPLNNVRAAGRNHQNGMNASSFVQSSYPHNGASFMQSSSFSVSTGVQSAQHRPNSWDYMNIKSNNLSNIFRFNRSEMLSLRPPPPSRLGNITKTYVDHDQPRMNGHMSTNGVHHLRKNKVIIW